MYWQQKLMDRHQRFMNCGPRWALIYKVKGASKSKDTHQLLPKQILYQFNDEASGLMKHYYIPYHKIVKRQAQLTSL